MFTGLPDFDMRELLAQLPASPEMDTSIAFLTSPPVIFTPHGNGSDRASSSSHDANPPQIGGSGGSGNGGAVTDRPASGDGGGGGAQSCNGNSGRIGGSSHDGAGVGGTGGSGRRRCRFQPYCQCKFIMQNIIQVVQFDLCIFQPRLEIHARCVYYSQYYNTRGPPGHLDGAAVAGPALEVKK